MNILYKFQKTVIFILKITMYICLFASFFLIFGTKYDIIGTTKAKEAENERDSHSTRRKSVAFVVSTK